MSMFIHIAHTCVTLTAICKWKQRSLFVYSTGQLPSKRTKLEFAWGYWKIFAMVFERLVNKKG